MEHKIIKTIKITSQSQKNQEVIPSTGHKEVLDSAKEATCTNTGLTEGKIRYIVFNISKNGKWTKQYYYRTFGKVA